MDMMGSYEMGEELGGGLRVEDVFDRPSEQFTDLECERQARRVLAGFERDDGLSRYPELIGDLGLRPIVLRAQDANAIRHA
jgi:hypothetical protein